MNKEIDFDEVARLVERGYITKRKHPSPVIWKMLKPEAAPAFCCDEA